MKRHTYLVYAMLLILGACIHNDIPYPLVDGSITAFEVECQCDENGNAGGTATINKAARSINLNVDDRVNPVRLRITRLQVTNNAAVSLADSTLANNYAKFPRKGFSELSELYISSDTRVDFTAPVKFSLTTYQQYDWTVTVNQIIKREILIEGQVGEAVIDPVNRNVVVYVDTRQDLTALKVRSFSLGGQHGTVLPDPTQSDTFDFSGMVQIYVKHAWEETSTAWRVFVYHTDQSEGAVTAAVHPMSTRAHISGTASLMQALAIEYRKTAEQAWTAVDASDIERHGTRFTAVAGHLAPATDYVLRVISDGQSATELTFTTAPAPALTDATFDNWHKDGKLWNPWAQGGTSFWDTGNRGATTVGDSNTVPTDDTCDGHGQAALLESKYIVVKFAAGNIFTGEYVQTDGTNGVLDFGRPFNGYPSALRVNYKYLTSTINRSADAVYEYLKGRPDSCFIYVLLADRDEPFHIRTRPSNRQLLDPHDPTVLAYGQLTVGDDVPDWTTYDIPLEYYPEAVGLTARYIVVVASASKYGDYFTGGEGSRLWIDNFELLYE